MIPSLPLAELPQTTTTGTGSDAAAWFALALSVVAIGAQLWTRFLDGGRVRVRMLPILWQPEYGSVRTFGSGHWPMLASRFALADPIPNDPSGHFEAAQILVENKGRYPVTVHTVGFQWRGKRPKWYRRRSVHHVSPRVFRIEGHGDRAYIEAREVRLEPYDQMSMVFDFWSILPPGRKSPRGKIKLRASVRVAGTRRPFLSERRRQWVIKDSAVSSLEGVTCLTVRGVIAQSLIRSGKGVPESLLSVSYFARRLESYIGGEWPEGWKQQFALMEGFLAADPEKEYGRASEIKQLLMSVSEAIESRKEVIDWSDVTQPTLFPRSVAAEESAEESDPTTMAPPPPAPRREQDRASGSPGIPQHPVR